MAVPRVHTAARAIGLARGSLEDSLQYAQELEPEQVEGAIGKGINGLLQLQRDLWGADRNCLPRLTEYIKLER